MNAKKVAIVGGIAAVLGWLFFRGRAQGQPLPPGDTAGVTGVVVAADTGTPIVGAVVQVPGLPTSAVSTDSTGRFTITGWAFSSIQLQVSYTNYATKIVSAAGLQPNTVKDMGTIALNLTSAIAVLGVTIPDGQTFHYNDPNAWVYFVVQNISGITATIMLKVTCGSLYSMQSMSAQLTLAPGQISDYYHTGHWPVKIPTSHLGAKHVTAYVDDLVVGEGDITVVA